MYREIRSYANSIWDDNNNNNNTDNNHHVGTPKLNTKEHYLSSTPYEFRIQYSLDGLRVLEYYDEIVRV